MSLLTGLFLKEAIASTALEHGEACSCTVCLAAGGDIGAFALIWSLVQEREEELRSAAAATARTRVPAGPGAAGDDAPGR
jgi:hypothetical protein